MIDLKQVKRQCRVDFDDDDDLLLDLLAAAEAEVTRITGRAAKELQEACGNGCCADWPAPVRQAILIRVAQLYRDPEGSEKPNSTFESLIRPYQKL